MSRRHAQLLIMAAARHGTTVERIRDSYARGVAETEARRDIWAVLKRMGLGNTAIGEVTGQHRASVIYGLQQRGLIGTQRMRSARRLKVPKPTPEPEPEPCRPGLPELLANIELLKLKHQRELASRY